MAKFAAAINCMDGRVQLPVTDYLKSRYGVDYVDMITLPGPNHVLALNEEKAAVESIKKCVEISITHHGVSLIAICGHYGCAANQAGEEVQKQEIIIAKEVLQNMLCDASVEVKGLWINQNWVVEEVNE